VYEDTDIVLADLSDFDRQTVEATITARSLTDAELIVDRLRPQPEATG
jgi:protein phosphatase